MLLYLLLSIGCVAANAFFVAAEFALAKVRPSALEALAKQGDADAARAYEISKRLDAYLSATQLGITLASLGLGWLGEPALARLIEGALAYVGVAASTADGEPVAWVHGIAATLAFAVISVAHIVIGELVPKSLAIQRPEQVSRWSSRPLRWFFIVSYPALWILNGASNMVLRALKLPVYEHAEGKLSHEELQLLIQASFSERGLEGTKRELLERVLRATDRPVRAVMIPRVDMIVLTLEADFETCMSQVRRFGYSRYPVAEDGDPDKISGYLYVKDLLMARRPRGRIGELKRDILFVPESRTVGELLNEFQRTKIPIALVVDEYGGTSGMVTLEDVVEELVGDIQDELHMDGPAIRLTEEGGAVVDGSFPMGELGLEGLVAEPIEGAETVGAYMLATLGRLAHPGDRINLGEFDAIVEDVRERRVHRVAIRPTQGDDSALSSILPPSSGS